MRPLWSMLTIIIVDFIIGELFAMQTAEKVPFHYDTFSPYGSVVPLQRHRRQASKSPLSDILDMSATPPPDVEKEEEDALSSEHTYYQMNIYPPKEGLMKEYYVDMLKWLNDSANGSTSHEHLDNSYRKAAAVKFGFKFPFYGHELSNMTIATGGFIYVGDQTHSWLAATQYIAPLMSNFDTMSNDSAIMYGTSKDRMIVEWSKVRLKDNRQVGPFTFQVSLFDTGDIWFVYKDIPISPQNISDIQHPCKLGISDAYLFNHKVPANSEKAGQPGKRVIHEYHRISILPEKITSNMVVVLKALPNCLDHKTCQDCSNSNLKHFRCSWCDPKDANGNPTKGRGFCSDQIGLNRRRQEWVEGSCAESDKRQVYCDATAVADNATSTATPDKTTKKAESTSEVSTSPDVKMLDKSTQKPQISKSSKEKEEAGGSGMAFFTLLLILAVGGGGWVAYAYMNPHSQSGQLLIKYRPSRWQMPSSHVRYSANVHM